MSDLTTTQVRMPALASLGLIKQVEDLSPEPLFESAPIYQNHLCLICGSTTARTALQTAKSSKPIVPMCSGCSSQWNTYGYSALKRIKPISLIVSVLKWFLMNPFQRSAVWSDLRRFLRWQGKMNKLRRARN
ncbi:MAG: hypothetical protein ACFCD0_19645 [Gemmataceae bacterium]